MNINRPMMSRRLFLGAAAAVPLVHHSAKADEARLEIFATHDSVLWNGVVVTPNGRVFVSLPAWLGPGAGVGELVRGELRPYPGSSWNEYGKSRDTANTLVSVNAIHLDPSGDLLWVVDAGAIPGQDRHKGAAKLVAFDLASNKTKYVFPLDDVLDDPRSTPNDIRILGHYGILSEPGSAAILTVDLRTGTAKRHLAGHPLLTARSDKPIIIDGRVLVGPNGEAFTNNANQLEISPDGKTLFIQPLNGGMARVPTDALLSDRATAEDIKAWIDTPPTSGTTMARDGTIYLNSINDCSIIRIDTEGRKQTLIRDERLRWADASWIANGYLWLPIAQLGWAPFLNGGNSYLQWPNPLMRLKLT